MPLSHASRTASPRVGLQNVTSGVANSVSAANSEAPEPGRGEADAAGFRPRLEHLLGSADDVRAGEAARSVGIRDDLRCRREDVALAVEERRAERRMLHDARLDGVG